MTALSVLFILSGKTWAIQLIKMWLQWTNNVPYYRLVIGTATILDYCVSGDIFLISVATSPIGAGIPPHSELLATLVESGII